MTKSEKKKVRVLSFDQVIDASKWFENNRQEVENKTLAEASATLSKAMGYEVSKSTTRKLFGKFNYKFVRSHGNSPSYTGLKSFSKNRVRVMGNVLRNIIHKLEADLGTKLLSPADAILLDRICTNTQFTDEEIKMGFADQLNPEEDNESDEEISQEDQGV